MRIFSSFYLKASLLGKRSLLTGFKNVPVISTVRKCNDAKAELLFHKSLNRVHENSMSSYGYDRAVRFLEASVPTVGFQTWISPKSNPSVYIPLTSEIFTPGIVYDLISHLPGINYKIPDNLLHLIESNMNETGLFNYFTNKRLSDDVDTTTVCLWALLQSNRVDIRLGKCMAKLIIINTVDDSTFSKQLQNGGQTNEESNRIRTVIITYFPPHNYDKTSNIGSNDACAMSNSMRVLLYFLKMHHLADDTLNFIHDWLDDDSKFLNGTKYYKSPESLLYFVSNSLVFSEDAKLKFGKILTQRLEERIGKSESALEISKRIITASNLGLISPAKSPPINSSRYSLEGKCDEVNSVWDGKSYETLVDERKLLREEQEVDGSWPMEVFYQNDHISFSNKAAVTAFVAKALHLSRHFKT